MSPDEIAESSTPEKLADGFEGAHQLLDDLERRLARKEVTPESVLFTLTKVVGALASHGMRPRISAKPLRGVGYGKDDAMIVASLPWCRKRGKESMSEAIRRHFGEPKMPKEEVDNHADRIRGHRREIEEIEGQKPWETSTNWLGDLPNE